MKLKKIALHLPTPCPKAWQEMAPAGQGRYCSQCAKTVIDFTSFDETQIQQYFQQYRGSICGRFQAHQLQTNSYPIKPPSIASRLALFLAIGLTGITGVATAHPIKDKSILSTWEPIVQPTNPDVSIRNNTIPTDSTYRITGQVWSEEDPAGPLPGVTVFIQGTNIRTYANKEGYFEIKLDHKPPKPIELGFSYFGFQAPSKSIDLADKLVVEVGKVTLIADTMALGEIVIVHNNPVSRLWWKIKGLFN